MKRFYSLVYKGFLVFFCGALQWLQDISFPQSGLNLLRTGEDSRFKKTWLVDVESREKLRIRANESYTYANLNGDHRFVFIIQ